MQISGYVNSCLADSLGTRIRNLSVKSSLVRKEKSLFLSFQYK